MRPKRYPYSGKAKKLIVDTITPKNIATICSAIHDIWQDDVA